MAKKKFIIILLFFSILGTACKNSTFPRTTPTVPMTPDITTVLDEEKWYSVYFTDPDSPTAGSYRGGPDDALADAIRGARLSVDIAIYHLNLWSIRDALITAHEAGVNVRVVVESDNLDEVEIQDLKSAGIEVLGDRRESYMHHKFVVIDKSEVWTGSMNFTINGAYYNDNNLICIRSSPLAENYTIEFEEMFITDMFGDDIVINTPYPDLSIEGTRVETWFSPDDGTAKRIIELIQGAQEQIDFMAFAFTSDDIADAMLERANAGITVTGVFEENQYYANIGTEYDRFQDAGLDIRLDGNNRNMHHKTIIIDDQVVILGSYNFSRNAEIRNDENTLIIFDSDIAEIYISEFERVFSKASME